MQLVRAQNKYVLFPFLSAGHTCGWRILGYGEAGWIIYRSGEYQSLVNQLAIAIIFWGFSCNLFAWQHFR